VRQLRGYTVADTTNLYLGHRPHGMTDPRAATKLGAYTIHEKVRRGHLGAVSPSCVTQLLNYCYSPTQIQQVLGANQSGALSPGGYQAIVSGFIDPSSLSCFLAADPGASAGGGSSLSAWLSQNAGMLAILTVAVVALSRK
jgi:hypothetical protein